MMKHYFHLQFTLINRWFAHAGVQPLLGWMIAAIGFFLFSVYLFSRLQYASFVYIIMAVAFMFKLSSRVRNEFLCLHFPRKKYDQLRLFENMLIASPFGIFLIYQTQYWAAGFLAILAVLLAFKSMNLSYSLVVPTPFSRFPFEFTVGFRKTFYAYFLAYGLTVIGIVEQNEGLGILALVVIIVTIVGYYASPEGEYYVWIYHLNPKQFLWKKFKTALLLTLLLCLPISLCLLFYSTLNWLIPFGIILLGLLFIALMIVVKYAAFPERINLLQALLLGLSIYFPLLMVVLLPYYYLQSIHKLNTILHD